jgi:phospholipid-transporting ATPase
VILERLSEEQLFREDTVKHLEDFAGQGLRTLCLSRVHLDEKDYEKWSEIWHEASTTVINRDQEVL